MKNKILLPFAFAGLLALSNHSNAQTVSMPYNGQDITVTKDTVAQLTFFAGKNIEGKTYLHWNVKNQSCNGTYIIYRSSNDRNYEVLGHKQGVGVTIPLPIAYYYQDEHPYGGTTYYKIVHIAENKSYIMSQKISVTAPEDVLGQLK